MEIKQVRKNNCLDLLPIFNELERYYFGEKAASESELASYLKQQVFSEYSGVKVVAAYDGQRIIGFATYTMMFPAPRLSGQMYMKDLFVSSLTRGKGVGLELIKTITDLKVIP